MRFNKLPSIFSAAPKGVIAEIVLGGFCLEVLALSVPIFTQVIFDKVIVHSSYSTLNVIAAGMIVVVLFEGLLVFLYSRHIHYLSARVDDFLMRPVMTQLLSLPLHYFDARPKGEIAAHVRDIADIRHFLAASSVSAVIDALFIVVILILMAFYSLTLALTVAACVPILAALSVVMRPSVRRQYKELSERQARFESLITEGLSNIHTIKTSALESNWLAKWVAAHRNFVDSALTAKRSAAVEETVLRVIQRLVVLAVLWVGATLVLVSALSFGQLIACYMYSLRVLGPSGRIFQVWIGLQRLQQAKRHLDDLLTAEPEQRTGAPRITLPEHHSILFRDVSFRYSPHGVEVLKSVSIEIPPGSFVGILGHSGSGKSTLARLIQRHYTPHMGAITLGDTDLRHIELAVLRQKIKLVLQDASVFQDTILNNLHSGDDSLSFEEVLTATRLVCAHDFIEALPSGYDTVLDERGAQFSSGQRQRLALARAVLQSPQVLVLDEATNALDAKTEQMVLANLRSALPDCTLIVITHRGHTLREADQILVVEAGQVHRRIQPYPAELFSAHGTPQLHLA